MPKATQATSRVKTKNLIFFNLKKMILVKFCDHSLITFKNIFSSCIYMVSLIPRFMRIYSTCLHYGVVEDFSILWYMYLKSLFDILMRSTVSYNFVKYLFWRANKITVSLSLNLNWHKHNKISRNQQVNFIIRHENLLKIYRSVINVYSRYIKLVNLMLFDDGIYI